MKLLGGLKPSRKSETLLKTIIPLNSRERVPHSATFSRTVAYATRSHGEDNRGRKAWLFGNLLHWGSWAAIEHVLKAASRRKFGTLPLEMSPCVWESSSSFVWWCVSHWNMTLLRVQTPPPDTPGWHRPQGPSPEKTGLRHVGTFLRNVPWTYRKILPQKHDHFRLPLFRFWNQPFS